MAVIRSITLDNTRGVSLTNRIVEIPLSSRTFRFGSVDSTGYDLDLLDSDQSTRIVHSLRLWGGAVGLTLDGQPWLLPLSGDGHNYDLSGQVQVADLGLGNGPHTLVSCGVYDNPDGSVTHGELNCYDKDHNHLWVFRSPEDDYVMDFNVADINGDGIPEIAIGFARSTHKAYVLDRNANITWTYDSGLFPPGTGLSGGPYLRTAYPGKMRNDLPGLQMFIGSSGGDTVTYPGYNTAYLSLHDVANNVQLWKIPLKVVAGRNASLQKGLVADLSNTGQAYGYVMQASMLFKVDNAGNIVWIYDHVTHEPNDQQTFYTIAAGHVTSTTTKQIVTYSCPQDTTTYAYGVVICVNDSGALLWERIIPVGGFGIACGDINGDGYDEVLVGYGTAGFGGLIVLDRNGDEIAHTTTPDKARTCRFADYDGSGSIGALVTCDDMHLHRYKIKTGSNVGATIKATIPSLTAGATKTIYLAQNPTANNPPAGDYYFNLSSATPPTEGTIHGGSWSATGTYLQSGDSVNVSAAECCEYALISTDGFELEFDAAKPAQGDGTLEYYVGVRYRCNTWGNDRPNGYQVIVGAKGTVSFTQTATTTGTVETLYTTASSGLTFSTSETVRFRLVVSGNDHSLTYRKSSGVWTLLFSVYDSTSPVTSAGSIAFINNRGQSKYSNIVIRTIPSSYGTDTTGPGPFASMDLLPSSTPIPMLALTGRVI